MKRVYKAILLIFLSITTIIVFKKNTYAEFDYSSVFNPVYYGSKYPDVYATYGMDYASMLQHFLDYGMDEGRQGAEEFNVFIYKNNYADLRNVFGDNLRLYYMHYITNGKAEGRVANKVIYSKSNDSKNQNTEIKAPEKNTVTISIAGDCTLGEYKGQGGGNQFKDYFNRFGADYFFENVRPIFSKDDITFVNLEGPLTNYEQVAVKTYPIKGDPRNIKCLTGSSIEVVNLSNNHIYDCGMNGFNETKTLLTQNNIGYCGEGNVYTVLVNGISVSFFGYQGWSNSAALRNQIETDLKNCKSNIKIVEFHWGIERDYVHNATQEALAHLCIDSGADLVVGAHPHVVQDVEVYNNKLICYSFGNFSFGANKNPSDKDTFILSATFNKVGMVSYEIIPCKISSVNNTNDYKPTPVTDLKEKERILHKMGL